MKDPSAPKIADLNRRIALCTQKDVVVDSSTMELRRTDVVWTWARIKSHYGFPSFMGQMGYTIRDLTTKVTHAVTVRSGLGLIITDTAYLYEEFRKSPPRWYKVLGFSEADDFTTMPVRLVEMSDQALPPQNSLMPKPSQVEL